MMARTIKAAMFADRLRAIRAREGLTQADLEKLAGMAPSKISQLEQGTIIDPSWSTVCRLADALGCSMDEFRRDLGTDAT